MDRSNGRPGHRTTWRPTLSGLYRLLFDYRYSVPNWLRFRSSNATGLRNNSLQVSPLRINSQRADSVCRGSGVIMNTGHCVRLVLPDRDEGAQGELLDRITERWGGCTCFRGFGLWIPEQGDRYREPIVIVECSVGHWTNQTRQWWHKLASDAALLLDQECVFLSVRSERALLADRDGTIRYTGSE